MCSLKGRSGAVYVTTYFCGDLAEGANLLADTQVEIPLRSRQVLSQNNIQTSRWSWTVSCSRLR